MSFSMARMVRLANQNVIAKLVIIVVNDIIGYQALLSNINLLSSAW
jgi:hypothetical protein